MGKIIFEIGSNKIKILKFNKKGLKTNVHDYRILNTPADIFNEDNVINVDELVDLLKDPLAELNAKGAELLITIHNERLLSRIRELPRIVPKFMKDAVQIEAEQFLPFDAEEFVIDYRVISEVDRNNEPMFKTMIIAVPKEIIYAYMEIAKKLKMKLTRIDAYINSINNYAQLFLVKEEQNILIADIGYDTMEMIVYEANQYFASIKSKFGCKNIIENLIQVLGMDEDAIYEKLFLGNNSNLITAGVKKTDNIYDENDNNTLKLKKLKERLSRLKEKNDDSLISDQVSVNLNKNNVDFASVLQGSFRDIDTELSRMIDYYQSRQYGARIHKIYVLGGAANVDGLIDYLNESLGIEVSNVPYSFKSKTVDIKDHNLLIPAIGCIVGGAN